MEPKAKNEIVSPSLHHRSVDGDALFAWRTGHMISQEQFALQCGHSRQYQQRIEAPGCHEVLTSRAEAIAASIVYFERKSG